MNPMESGGRCLEHSSVEKLEQREDANKFELPEEQRERIARRMKIGGDFSGYEKWQEKLKIQSLRMPIEGHGGHWEGERGNSKWKPEPEEIPKNLQVNPEQKNNKKILDQLGIDGILFKDGYPNFSEISKETVEIDDFTDDRSSNFDQADEKLAEQRGCLPEDVEQWRKEHGYTWHEMEDMRTMQKVPSIVHGTVPHEGGIAAYKKQNSGVKGRGD